jgi:hypothetical protein
LKVKQVGTVYRMRNHEDSRFIATITVVSPLESTNIKKMETHFTDRLSSRY